MKAALIGIFSALAALLGSVSPAFADAKAGPDSKRNAADSVVKIYATLSRPDLGRPWARLPPLEETGTGVILPGKRILTSAHFVFYASELQVKGDQAGDKISARVVAVAPDLDLVVLRLDDESFFDSHPPMPTSTQLPKPGDLLSVYGYPSDSMNVSIVKAAITHTDFGSYRYPASGLRIRINQEIGPGDSGGPALDGGVMIGISCRRGGASGASSASFIMPQEEIMRFLDQVGGPRPYQGKPALEANFQKLENPALRSYLKLDRGMHGVVVGRQDADSGDADSPLKDWDVVSQIGAASVDDEGTVDLGDNQRVAFTYQVQRTTREGPLPLKVYRQGAPLSLKVPLEVGRKRLVADLDGAYPSYFIFGPIVFSEVSREVVNGLSGSKELEGIFSYRGSPLVTRAADVPAFEGEQLVFVPCPLFPHKLAQGYSDPAFEVVKNINGIAVKSLLHLVQVLRDSKDPFVTVEFWEKDSEILVFPREAAIAATDSILSDNGVRYQGSPDALAAWSGKPPRH